MTEATTSTSAPTSPAPTSPSSPPATLAFDFAKPWEALNEDYRKRYDTWRSCSPRFKNSNGALLAAVLDEMAVKIPSTAKSSDELAEEHIFKLQRLASTRNISPLELLKQLIDSNCPKSK